MLASISVISIASLAAMSAANSDSVKPRSVASARTDTVRVADVTSVALDVTERTDLVGGILTTAARYLGARYVLGGTKPGAFDCSGFVRYVFAKHGVLLPRTAREQATVGRTVVGGLDSLRTGDLLFFRTRRGRAAHVAIYVGEGRIIHASSGSRRVRYDDLASNRGRWFVRNLSGVRRVVEPSEGALRIASLDFRQK